MDKSRSTQITDTENIVNKENKSGSVSSTSLNGKSTNIEKLSGVDIINDGLIISVFLHR